MNNAYKALDKDSFAKVAWYATRGCPIAKRRVVSFRQHEWLLMSPAGRRFDMQQYLGIAPEVIHPYIGKMVGRGGINTGSTTVDKEAWALWGGRNNAAIFTKRHNSTYPWLQKVFQSAGVYARFEPCGEIDAIIQDRAASRGQPVPPLINGGPPDGTLSNVVPDILFQETEGISIGMRFADMKFRGAKNHYRLPGAGSQPVIGSTTTPCDRYAVERLAARVHKDVVDNARRRDTALFGSQVARPGPVQDAVSAYGDIMALQAGRFGEVNEDFNKLIQKLASKSVSRRRAEFGVSSTQRLTSTITHEYRNRLGGILALANWNFVQERLQEMHSQSGIRVVTIKQMEKADLALGESANDWIVSAMQSAHPASSLVG